MNIKEIAERQPAGAIKGAGAVPWSSDPAVSMGGVFAQTLSAPGSQRRGSSTGNLQRFLSKSPRKQMRAQVPYCSIPVGVLPPGFAFEGA